MAEKIEISILKIFIIIAGIISLTFAWMILIIEVSYLGYTITATFEYNFLGMIINASIGNLKLDPSDYNETNELTLWGLCYLFGFLLSLINVRIDDQEKYKNLGKVGLLLIVIGICGYVLTFLWLFHEAQLELQNDSSLATINMYYTFGLGFYGAIAVGIFTLLELNNTTQNYLAIYNRQIPQYQATTPYMQPVQAQPVQPIQQTQENLTIDVKYCQACGQKVMKENAKFCETCGHNLRK